MVHLFTLWQSPSWNYSSPSSWLISDWSLSKDQSEFILLYYIVFSALLLYLFISESMVVWPFLHFVLPGGSLSETHQGAARERQTHLCQHVPEVCREGLKGERLFSTTASRGRKGRVFLRDCTRGHKSWFVFFSLSLMNRKKQIRWRLEATAMMRWRSRMETKKQQVKRKCRWRWNYGSSVRQTFVTLAICV